MKKIIATILTMVLLFSCVTALAEEEQLNEYEQLLVDALIKVSTDYFYEPSAVRVLEIDAFEKTAYYPNVPDSEFYPWNVFLRIQGENRVGGTLNHYYLLCIKSGEGSPEKKDYIEANEQLIESKKMLGRDPKFSIQELYRHKAQVGDILDLGDSNWEKNDEASVFSIKKINKALKAYWEDMGF